MTRFIIQYYPKFVVYTIESSLFTAILALVKQFEEHGQSTDVNFSL